MKRILLVSLVAFAAGCGGGSGDPGSAATMQSDATLAPNGSIPANGSATAPGASVAEDSRSFLMAAYQDGMREIALSELALQRASDTDVRKFAQRMIDHHMQSNSRIRQLAQEHGVSLSNALTEEQREPIETMTNLNGIQFDRAYMQYNVMMHDRDVALFRSQALSGTDVDVRTFAENTLPALQLHLVAAKAIHGKIDPAVYLMNAYQDGRAEILLSTLALQRTGDAAVRDFAQRMIDDHTRANNEIMQLAYPRDIALPEELTAEHRAVYEDISGMSGRDFDKAYMNHNVLVHEVDVAQTRAQAEQGTAPDIRAFAARTLPVLSMHLQMATDIYQDIEPSLLFLAFQDGMGEILLSQLALQKSSDDEVRQFAQRMIDDHSRANNEVRQLGEAKGRMLPREVSPEIALSYLRLSQLEGRGFDQAYMERNVEAHAKDVQHFEQHAQNEVDPDIRAFATATLPVLRTHLETAMQIESRLDSASTQE
jgi:predicted outer membrane protein